MVKYQDRNGALQHFRKSKTIFEKTVPNGAVLIIDFSREHLCAFAASSATSKSKNQDNPLV
jgi:hypothetical protein